MPVGEGWDMPVEFQGWSDFHWWKISGNRVLNLVMVSEKPTWYSGHFVKGRMEPCYGEGCKACSEGVGAQARYIFAAVEPISRKIGLLEVSRTVALEFRDMSFERGQLRGTYFEISKHSRHKQSRMEIHKLPELDGFVIAAFEVPDIKAALRLTWEKAGFEIPPTYHEQPEAVSSEERPVGPKKAQTGTDGPLAPQIQRFKDRAKGAAKAGS